MLPAHQGFDADQLAGTNVHLRLVVKNKLPGRKRLANMFQVLVAAARNQVLSRIEFMEAISASELCLVHRLPGLAEQHIGVHVF